VRNLAQSLDNNTEFHSVNERNQMRVKLHLNHRNLQTETEAHFLQNTFARISSLVNQAHPLGCETEKLVYRESAEKLRSAG
jgi:hypothetical protein